jgi:hypothetical protein
MTKVKDVHLLAFYVMKPRDPKRTSQKGYMSDPANITYDERIEFTVGLSSKDQRYAGVILNLGKKQVVYNKFGNGKTFDDMFKYFLEGYPDYVSKAMALLDKKYLEQFLPKEQPKEEAVPAE